MKRQSKSTITFEIPLGKKIEPAAQSGAPAALDAIAKHELRCRNEKEEAYAIWQEAKRLRVDGDDVSERAYNRAYRDYLDALEAWDESSKRLLAYDTKIAPTRREGEKIGVDEAKEFFRQYELSIDLALEALIVQLSQAAALCSSPEEFHAQFADQLRSAKRGALDAALREGCLPKWICEP